MVSNIKNSELKKVIDGGYCIGCGLCAFETKNKIEIKMNSEMCYKASFTEKKISKKELNNASFACPFTNIGPNEDQISDLVFKNLPYNTSGIGKFVNLYVGHVIEGSFRKNGTSGGLVTWIACELLRLKKVDGIIHVGNGKNDGILFDYKISNTESEIMSCSKSRYYPITLKDVIKQAVESKKRYAVVGVPCFIKGLRKIMINNKNLDLVFPYFIGLVCGHLKSGAFAESIAWNMGIHPSELKNIDFRVKIPNHKASNYGVYVESTKKNQEKNICAIKNLSVTNWGLNLFRYNACNYCDDVMAETADVSIGDAWLKKYESDSKGNSIIIVRNREINSILSTAIYEKRLALNKISENQVLKSQQGGLNDRREGLRYRLFIKKQKGLWSPIKRVSACASHLNSKRKNIYSLRMQFGNESHSLWKKAKEINSFQHFEQAIILKNKEIQALKPFLKRITTKVIRLLKIFIR